MAIDKGNWMCFCGSGGNNFASQAGHHLATCTVARSMMDVSDKAYTRFKEESVQDTLHEAKKALSKSHFNLSHEDGTRLQNENRGPYRLNKAMEALRTAMSEIVEAETAIREEWYRRP